MPQFDYGTISDVVLHLRYTAREGGLALQEKVAAAATVGSVRLLSVRQEFATDWARFTAATVAAGAPPAALTITLREEHYPFWARQTEGFALHSIELFASAGDGDLTVYDAETDEPAGSRHESTLSADPSVGGLRTGPLTGPLPAAVGTFTLYLDDNSITDLWLALVWGAAD